MKTKIDAIIIGAARAGTTTLSAYLKEQPEIDFSLHKEVHYFAFDDLYKKGDNYLRPFFQDNGKIKITADTYLMIDKKATDRIKKYNPDMKFILILREPVSRAFSGYNYSVRNGYLPENMSFKEAVNFEQKYQKSDDIVQMNNQCNLLRSKYYYFISYWQRYFPKDNFLLLKTANLKENPKKVIKEVCRFLDIPSYELKQDIGAQNQAFSVKSKSLQQFMVNRNNKYRRFLKRIIPRQIKEAVIKSSLVTKIAEMNRRPEKYPPISPEEYNYAYQYLAKDIEKLKSEFGIDFSNQKHLSQ
jgi:hypothetical protein